MIEKITKAIDALPASVWIMVIGLLLSGVGWIVKTQFDQDRHIAVLEEQRATNARAIEELKHKQDLIIQYLNPHPQMPPP